MNSAFICLYLTKECNSRCKHCFNDSGGKINNELSLEEITQLVEEIDARYDKAEIQFSGGEPTLREDFGEILDLFNKEKFNLYITSNGTNIPKYAKKLNEMNAQVSFTFYGIEKTHDEFAQRKGAFSGLVKSLKLINDGNAGVIIHKDNLKQGKKIASFLKNLLKNKPSFCTPWFEVPQRIGRGASLEEISKEEYIVFMKSVKKVFKETDTRVKTLGEILKTKLPLAYIEKRIKDNPFDTSKIKTEIVDGEKVVYTGPCYYLWLSNYIDTFSIYPNGDVYSSCVYSGSHRHTYVGNIREKGFNAIKRLKPNELHKHSLISKFIKFDENEPAYYICTKYCSKFKDIWYLYKNYKKK